MTKGRRDRRQSNGCSLHVTGEVGEAGAGAEEWFERGDFEIPGEASGEGGEVTGNAYEGGDVVCWGIAVAAEGKGGKGGLQEAFDEGKRGKEGELEAGQMKR